VRRGALPGGRRGGVAAGLLAALLPLLLPAGAAAAPASAAFLPTAGDARAFGLAGAGAVLADGASAVLLNPARLVFARQKSITAGYWRPIEGLASDRIELAFAHPLGPDIAGPGQTRGVSPFAYGVTAQYQGVELSLGSNYWEGALGVAAGVALQSYAALGVGVRALRADSDLDGVQASGVAVDLALDATLYPGLDAAFVGRNLIGSARYDGAESEGLVRAYLFGLAWTPRPELAAELDFQAESGGAYAAALGLEAVLKNTLLLRAGARQWIQPESRLVPAAGFGVRLAGFTLDYGAQFDADAALGLGHRVSLSARF
jgi:hypothetical protein